MPAHFSDMVRFPHSVWCRSRVSLAHIACHLLFPFHFCCCFYFIFRSLFASLRSFVASLRCVDSVCDIIILIHAQSYNNYKYMRAMRYTKNTRRKRRRGSGGGGGTKIKFNARICRRTELSQRSSRMYFRPFDLYLNIDLFFIRFRDCVHSFERFSSRFFFLFWVMKCGSVRFFYHFYNFRTFDIYCATILECFHWRQSINSGKQRTQHAIQFTRFANLTASGSLFSFQHEEVESFPVAEFLLGFLLSRVAFSQRTSAFCSIFIAS